MAYDAAHYTHPSDLVALKALKAIPGFPQFVKGFMKIWSERQFRVSNMSSCVRINENQLSKYYDMLPPICEKLGIDVPELYLQLDVSPNAKTAGETKPFIIVTSGLFETLPDELIPTVLAHECGHIACHHVLYSTMGNILLGESISALRSFVPYGNLASMPLEVAFYYWMRCSELSADRAAVLCDGTAEKMSEVCLRLAGYDKDIQALANKEEFLAQAREYRDMVTNSKWDKTLEFLMFRSTSHPLMTVRALECEEWAKTEQFQQVLNGTFEPKPLPDEEFEPPIEEESESEKKTSKFEFPFKRKEKVTQETSVPDEIRKYKALLEDGIITEEEFNAKKAQLLGL